MLCSLKLVLLLSVVIHSLPAQAQLELEMKLVRRLSNPSNRPNQRNSVTLSCILINTTNPGATLPVEQLSYYYRDSSVTSSVAERLTYELHDSNRITFVITPDTEGDYFCGDAQNRESNDLQLTAYPIPDESLTQTVYAGQEGGRVILPCDFKPGRLSNLYTYHWYRTDTGIIFNGDSDSDKYVTGSDFSLQINNLNSSDNASYQCIVEVDNPVVRGNDFSVLGRVISLEVYDAVRITHAIETQTVREGDVIKPFICVAQGTPLPIIQWYFNGSVIDAENGDFEGRKFNLTMEIAGDNETTSTLTVTEIQSVLDVEIVCNATNQPVTLSESFTNHSIAYLTVFQGCISGNHKCHRNATCVDTVGGFLCECSEHFVGDGFKCMPIESLVTVVALGTTMPLFLLGVMLLLFLIFRRILKKRNGKESNEHIYDFISCNELGYAETTLESRFDGHNSTSITVQADCSCDEVEEQVKADNTSLVREDHYEHLQQYETIQRYETVCYIYEAVCTYEHVKNSYETVQIYECAPSKIYESVPTQTYERVPAETYESVPVQTYESVSTQNF